MQLHAVQLRSLPMRENRRQNGIVLRARSRIMCINLTADISASPELNILSSYRSNVQRHIVELSYNKIYQNLQKSDARVRYVSIRRMQAAKQPALNLPSHHWCRNSHRSRMCPRDPHTASRLAQTLRKCGRGNQCR